MARDYETTVRNLLNKAEDPSIPESEKEALQERAFTLMSKYQITIALEKSNEDKQVHMVLDFDAPYPLQKMSLYNIIAGHFNLSLIKTDRNTCHVFGYRSDFESTEFLYSILYNQVMASLASVTIPSHINARTYRTSWFIGFSNKIGERLKASKKAAQATSEPGAAVVLMDRARLAEAKRAEVYKRITTGHKSRAREHNAYSSGQEAGSRAQFHDGTGVGNSRREIE